MKQVNVKDPLPLAKEQVLELNGPRDLGPCGLFCQGFPLLLFFQMRGWSFSTYHYYSNSIFYIVLITPTSSNSPTNPLMHFLEFFLNLQDLWPSDIEKILKKTAKCRLGYQFKSIYSVISFGRQFQLQKMQEKIAITLLSGLWTCTSSNW